MNEIKDIFERLYKDAFAKLVFPINFEIYFNILEEFLKDQKYIVNSNESIKSIFLEFLKNTAEKNIRLEVISK